mmetsp:Transcript_49668/g.55448  ORF Transcript_49668/g.55448 Transcript_49668/m.55448 type:complete len:260 (-) Transcript_49668:6-785(-)
MMIYQQTMLASTIESTSSHGSSLSSSSFIDRRKILSRSIPEQEFHQQQDVRSVNFSSCTTKKQEETQQEKHAGGVKKRSSSSSNSVPIPDCMFRSPSELQLTMDEQVANERDFAFFARLVNGISERRSALSTTSTANTTRTDIDRCLTHIIQTQRHHYQSHHDQEEEAEVAHCDEVLIENDDYQVGGVYYLGEDLDCVTLSSSSSSSSSNASSSILYQHAFVDYVDEAQHKETHRNSNDNNDDLYNNEGDYECMFDLEL